MPGPALASLLALLVLILVSCVSRLNVGVLGLALAWGIGVVVADGGTAQVLAGFPTSLLVTLLGVTLLFGAAEVNGTLERVARRAVGLAGGRGAWLPAALFGVAFLVASSGPGAILAVAVTAPLAMSIGLRAGVPAFIVALAVANGANAGNLSPVSAVGIIANTRMAEAGLPGHEWRVWLAGFVAHVAVTVLALGAWRFRERAGRERFSVVPATGRSELLPGEPAMRLERAHWITLLVVGVWIAVVVTQEVHIGLAAFAAAGVLFLLRQAGEAPSFARVPVAIVVMVTGMATLVALVERTGGMSLFADGLARLATAGTVNGLMGFVTGLISTYSSTSAVVLPAFLPTAPQVAAQVGGDPVAVSLSITVGSALVDVSPLSTLGALCVAAVAAPETARQLFRQLLVWGLSMTIVGAVLVQALAGWLARW